MDTDDQELLVDEADLAAVDPTGLGLDGIDVTDLGTYTAAELAAAFPDIVDLFEESGSAARPAVGDSVESLRSLLARGALMLEIPAGADDDARTAAPVLRAGTALGIVDLHRRLGDRIGLVQRRHPVGGADLAIYRYSGYDDGQPTFVIELADGPFRRYLIAELASCVAATCRVIGLDDEVDSSTGGDSFEIDLDDADDDDRTRSFRDDAASPLDVVVISVDRVPSAGPADLTVLHGETGSWVAESPDPASSRYTVTPLRPSIVADWLRDRLS